MVKARARTLSSVFMAGHGRFPVCGVPYITTEGADRCEYTRRMAVSSSRKPRSSRSTPHWSPFSIPFFLALSARATLVILTDAQTVRTQLRCHPESWSRPTPLPPAPLPLRPGAAQLPPFSRRCARPPSPFTAVVAAAPSSSGDLHGCARRSDAARLARDDAGRPQEEERVAGAGAPLLDSCDERVGGGRRGCPRESLYRRRDSGTPQRTQLPSRSSLSPAHQRCDGSTDPGRKNGGMGSMRRCAERVEGVIGGRQGGHPAVGRWDAAEDAHCAATVVAGSPPTIRWILPPRTRWRRVHDYAVPIMKHYIRLLDRLGELRLHISGIAGTGGVVSVQELNPLPPIRVDLWISLRCAGAARERSGGVAVDALPEAPASDG
ncbi:hypothetical protein B0H17DRAFT_1192322 [Mycena rosella]|uniref:Uncharacterized protein n=1 Tax=Mycena rosella TaxID=1033263 RepID=A0AAD7GWB9_MYCRO|nr:hypothetical protein B0H17DRAFT_1192322 [Mycena rosella]